MIEKKRPLLAPTTTFDRMVYALLALMAPRMLIHMAYLDQVDLGWSILCAWWLVTFLYTIDWAIASHRIWLSKKGTV